MSTTAVVLGADNVVGALDGLGGYDEIVVLDGSVDALERVMHELADPRLDYLLGELPVLPLPDRSVHLLIGGDASDEEVARVLAN